MNKLVSEVKILVVDDEPLIVDELCEFLEKSGYRCVPALSSQVAIDRFKEDPEVALVLCDLHLPDLDGVELVRELQRFAGKRRIFESIMLTELADKQDVIKALRAGIADYYQKPVDLDELLEGIQRQEAVIAERKQNENLGQLNQKLQFLAESIDDLYRDLDNVRRPSSAQREVNDEGAPNEADNLETVARTSQLSPRQVEVARLVGKGQTNYQIACELGITENTVKLYVSQVLRLTHMHNRTQLALALAPGGLRQRNVTAH
ncbi:response regulator transcription factor [Pseudomonas asplenii]|uniref:response regulator transcription factor n=1 Tax=Pseudomonas asplenii TaxID=53407 RepID=UPI002234151C|nr:response regulator transcription factor [Pseudomonas asplenii]UZE29758.1 response regulator transcription factor [Pseudomonas asplenii]